MAYTKIVSALIYQSECFYCGAKIDLKYRTRDHIISKSKGGGSAQNNMVMACRVCNGVKGSKDVYAFIKYHVKASRREKVIQRLKEIQSLIPPHELWSKKKPRNNY